MFKKLLSSSLLLTSISQWYKGKKNIRETEFIPKNERERERDDILYVFRSSLIRKYQDIGYRQQKVHLSVFKISLTFNSGLVKYDHFSRSMI